MRLTLHSRTQSGARASPPATAIRYSLFTIHYQNAFTVLELVMVVGVLSLLLAAVVPTIKTVRTAALRRQAAAEATALAQAAIRYKAEYGFWPGQVVPHASDPYSVRLNPKIERQDAILHLIVCGPEEFTNDIEVEITDPNILRINDNAVYQAFCTVGPSSGSDYPLNPLNPKGIPFLPLTNENDFERVDYPDPWGRPYRLVMGLHPETVFTVTIKRDNTVIYEKPISNTVAFAFSRGPAGPNNTNYIYSAGVRP
jgi:type II secretory pathway pseudopilin PulG